MIYEDINLFKNAIDQQGVLMSLDVGTKKIGVATSDFNRIIATPKTIIRKKLQIDSISEIKKIIDEFNVVAIIIGLPLHMNNSESEISQYVRKFADILTKSTPSHPILLLDERLSTFMAFEIIKENKRTKKRAELIDKISAGIILEYFLSI